MGPDNGRGRLTGVFLLVVSHFAMKKAAWIVLVLSWVLPALAQDVETFTPSISDVIFLETRDQELALDVYLPSEPASGIPAPVS